MQIRDFSKVPYLSFFDFGSNKGLCPLFQSPLFGVSTVVPNMQDLNKFYQPIPSKNGALDRSAFYKVTTVD